ncbi:MAG: ATP-dependent endonuclease, partial [Clostridiales Family XIII bacterium]|nr:ATP-dependent endonuclease [Clostridiales Family XIII bacterium]
KSGKKDKTNENDKQPKKDEKDEKYEINESDEKHLRTHFPEIKEAFYSKCVIMVEGETEYGCLNSFATKLEIILDDYGICLLNARGQKSIKPIRLLLQKFNIPSIAIYDSDYDEDSLFGVSYDKSCANNLKNKKEKNKIDGNEFYTEKRCFEFDIVDSLVEENKLSVIKDISKSVIKDISINKYKHFDEVIIDEALFSKYDKDKKIIIINNIKKLEYYNKKLSEVPISDKVNFRMLYSVWFENNKGFILGRIIGDIITKDCIPDCYKNAIIGAKSLVIEKEKIE